MDLPPRLSNVLSFPSSGPERTSAMPSALQPNTLPQPSTLQRRALSDRPVGFIGLLMLDDASVNAFEEVALTFFCANDWLGTKVVVAVAVLLICIGFCVQRMCRGKGKVSFKDRDEYDEEPLDDDLWERGMARQARRVTSDPPRRGRRATRSLHEAEPPAPRPDARSSPAPRSSPASRLSPIAKPSPQRGEVIAKPVLDFVKPAADWTTQQVQAAKESAAGKAVNKAVESTVQQVKDSHAGQAVGSTTQRVKETPAGQAINKAFDFVGELFAPFPEATQAYLEPDSNMPAPPPAYWRRAPPASPSASRRAAMENAKVRPPPKVRPAPKELV